MRLSEWIEREAPLRVSRAGGGRAEAAEPMGPIRGERAEGAEWKGLSEWAEWEGPCEWADPRGQIQGGRAEGTDPRGISERG